MDNQHRYITGDRELSEAEIAQINQIKQLGSQVGALVDRVIETPWVDLRWATIARTELQQGFMALVRAVAQPDGF